MLAAQTRAFALEAPFNEPPGRAGRRIRKGFAKGVGQRNPPARARVDKALGPGLDHGCAVPRRNKKRGLHHRGIKGVLASFPVRGFAAKAFVLLLLLAAGSSPPRASATASLSPAPTHHVRERTQGFVAQAIPYANFVSQASRMAVAFAHDKKLRKLAADLARSQNAAAVSLAEWVNVSTSVVTRRSPYAGRIGGARTRLSAPGLLPHHAKELQRLSVARGTRFDALYISTVRKALARLKGVYEQYGQGGADPGLQAIAADELPNVKHAISALGRSHARA